MGWFSRSAPVETAPEQRSISISDPAVAALLGYNGFGTPSVSEDTAVTLSAVFRSVSLVAGALGGLPLRTLARGADGTQTRADSFLDDPGLDRFTAFEWKELVAVYLLLHGGAPLQHIYGGGGQLIGLNPIHPRAVQVDADAGAVGGRRFTVTLDDGSRVELDGRTMTYIPGISLDGVRGISVLTAARLGLGTAISGDKAANRMFSNGAMVAGMITPEEDLTEDEAKIVKETVNKTVLGAEHAGDIPVINRRLKFQPWTLSAADAQFLESRSFSVEEVGRWFGVPPHLLGQSEKSTSWGTGIEEQNRGLARYTLRPWTTRIEERLSRLLPAGRSAEFDYSAFLQPSPEDEITLLIQQVNAGLLTLNEARRIRNLPALPADTGADLPRTPAGAVSPLETQANLAQTEESPVSEEEAP